MPLVNPVVVFFVGVELQVGETQLVQNATNIGYVAGRAQHSAAAVLIVGCAREVFHQPFAKLGILRREHLGLHAAEPAGTGYRSRRAVVAARLAGCGALGVDDADVLLGGWQCGPRHMAEALFGQGASIVDAQREHLWHLGVVDSIHSGMIIQQ